MPPMSTLPPTDAHPQTTAARAAARKCAFMELLTRLARGLFPLLFGALAADLLHALGVAQDLGGIGVALAILAGLPVLLLSVGLGVVLLQPVGPGHQPGHHDDPQQGSAKPAAGSALGIHRGPIGAGARPPRRGRA